MVSTKDKLCAFPADVWCTGAIAGYLVTDTEELAIPEIVDKIDPSRRCLWIQEHQPEYCLDHRNRLGTRKEV